MRSALFALVALAATAHAAPYRPVHPDATGEELLHLARARIAERAGDLDKAQYQYRQALAVAKRANTYWNLADLQRRMEEYSDAIRTFEQFKELATTDADRAAADAEIAAIKKIPMRISLSGHESEETYVFLDGAKKGTAPLLAELPDGRHVVDLISASEYDHRRIDAKSGTAERLRQRENTHYGRDGGNVVLAGSPDLPDNLRWRDGDIEYRFPGRFTLPPGTYETTLGDSDRWVCNKLKFTVPKKGAVFVFVAVAHGAPKGCVTAKVASQVVPL